jgi:hypothetical protein
MKKILAFLSFLALSFNTMAQTNDFTISFDGIGKVKLWMGKAELEKLLNMKIVLKHIGIDQLYTETISAKYMGLDIELNLFRSEEKVAVLEGIRITDPKFKLPEGIGIGTDELTIINKFENHLLIMHPNYENLDGPEYKLSKTNSTITLANIDNIDNAIIFSLVNKKVVAIEVGPTAEFRDRE